MAGATKRELVVMTDHGDERAATARPTGTDLPMVATDLLTVEAMTSIEGDVVETTWVGDHVTNPVKRTSQLHGERLV